MTSSLFPFIPRTFPNYSRGHSQLIDTPLIPISLSYVQLCSPMVSFVKCGTFSLT